MPVSIEEASIEYLTPWSCPCPCESRPCYHRLSLHCGGSGAVCSL